ncbi:MAG: MATE family efflux transporter [Lachnospiraceae bacterium]|nr:MATE family efflux transporter [Lachnospiraceae bacterium]
MKDLTKGSIPKAIIGFMIPVFFGQLFQLFYSLVDTRIVGSTLGNDALAAVGATTTLNTLIIGFLVGLTNGFAVITAQNFGAGNKDRVRKSVALTLELGLGISLVLTVVSLALLPKILIWLNTPEEHLMHGYEYISVIIGGMTFAMLYNVCASALRAIGDTVTPLLFLVFSTILNIFLDYGFIRGLHMGVEGAAYATVLSQLIAFLLCIVYMFRKYEFLRLTKEDLAYHGAQDSTMARKMLATGISMGLMSSLVSLGTVALQSSINTFGTNIIVAHTAARKVTELFMMPFAVMGMTMTTYCGQNLGAGQFSRIRQGIWWALGLTWAWCALVLVAAHTISPWLVQLVTATKITEVIETASWYLRVDTTLYFVTAIITVVRNSLQGIGDPITPIVSSFIELVGKVAAVFVLAPRLGYFGIILTEPIVWVLMVIPLILRILTMKEIRGDLMKKEI